MIVHRDYQHRRRRASGFRLAACRATVRAAAQYFADRTPDNLEEWRRAAERAWVLGFAEL